METSRPNEPRDMASGAVLGVHHTAPAFDVPDGACDCHVHIFGTNDQYPFADDRPYMPSPASVDDLLALHRGLGIQRAVVVQASPQGFDNRCLVEALRALSERSHGAAGVAVVPPGIRASELADLHEAGVRGLRVNLQSHGSNDLRHAAKALTAAAARAADFGWHVQVYTNLRMIAGLESTIASLPAPLVVDHFALASAAAGPAQEGFDALLRAVGSGRAYVKLSAPYRILDDGPPERGLPLVRSLIEANLERMLWGTDWPHTGARPGIPRMRDAPEPFLPIDDGTQMRHLGSWTTPAERDAILVRNPQRLYGF